MKKDIVGFSFWFFFVVVVFFNTKGSRNGQKSGESSSICEAVPFLSVKRRRYEVMEYV